MKLVTPTHKLGLLHSGYDLKTRREFNKRFNEDNKDFLGRSLSRGSTDLLLTLFMGFYTMPSAHIGINYKTMSSTYGLRPKQYVEELEYTGLVDKLFASDHTGYVMSRYRLLELGMDIMNKYYDIIFTVSTHNLLENVFVENNELNERQSKVADMIESEVNIDDIRSGIKYMTNINDKDRDRVLAQFHKLYNNHKFQGKDGLVTYKPKYTNSRTGRMFEVGTGVQGISKIIKRFNYMNPEYHNYDISNSQLSLLAHYVREMNRVMDIDFSIPAITSFINDSDSKTKLGNELGLDRDTVKKLIYSTVFEGIASNSPYTVSHGLLESDKIEVWKTHKLYKEIRVYFKLVGRYIKTHLTKDRIFNNGIIDINLNDRVYYNSI
jgi:hypothetical protein